MCDETGFGLKKTKRNRITVFRSANRFPVYRLQHYLWVKNFVEIALSSTVFEI